jgi:methylase of polypeptide subunit release factors
MASLIYEATLHLYSGGKLILEIGCGQAEDVSIIARECGFGEVRLVNDYSGIPRCAVFSDYSQ